MFGFFSFVLKLTAWCVLLQWTGRCLFLFLRGAYQQMSTAEWLLSFGAGFSLDMAFAGYFLIFGILMYWLGKALTEVLPRKLFLLVGLIFLQITIIINLADAELYLAWGSKFNRQALQYLQSPKEAAASSSGVGWWTLSLCWFIFSVIFFRYLLKISRLISFSKETARQHIHLAGKSLVSIAVIGIVVRGGVGNIPINQSVAVFSSNPAANMAAINSGWNFLYYIINKNEKIDPEKYHFYKQGDDEKLLNHFFAHDYVKTPISHLSRPNVCIVILESFSAYGSQFLTGTNNAMPYIDRLQKEGLSFKRAYASGDRTDKGLAAVLSGWHGQPWQSILHEPDKAAKLPSLAGLFAKNGYRTGFIYGGDLGFANMRSYLYANGFQHIQDQSDFAKTQLTSKWGAHDEWSFNKLLKLNKESTGPFFHVLLTLSSHEPYDVPGGPYYTSTSPQKELLNSIAYTDQCVRKFMQEASKQNWFHQTLFVFVADHGRDLGYPETQFDRAGHFHIPLFFWGEALHPKLKGVEWSAVVSQTGIAETLNQGLALSNERRFSYSDNLLSATAHSQAVYIFNSGFGVIHDTNEVVFHNQPGRTTFKKGNPHFCDSLTGLGQAFQYRQILRYLDF